MRAICKITVMFLVVLLLALPNALSSAAPKAKVKQRPEAVVKTAERYLKTPYKFGGETPKGFDCSGFVMFVYDKHGKKLPRSADIQFREGKKVARKSLKPGDLVFFNTYASGVSHVGIYSGAGKFIHVSSSRGVMVSRLDEPYWKPRYLGARRIMK